MNDLTPSSDAVEIALEKVLSSASFRGRPQSSPVARTSGPVFSRRKRRPIQGVHAWCRGVRP